MDAKEMLNKYSDNLVGLDSLRLEKQAVIDTILTPEIKEKLAEIEAEFAPKVEALSAENERLAAQIREQVLELGATVSGDFHQAIFTKGRVSWDTKALDGYAAAHPEVATFRKEGQPSVSIRLRG
jgi:hypothetical protein